MSDVCPLEDYTFRGKFVQIRRVHLYASVTCNRVRSLLVRKKKNQIGFSVRSHNFQVGTKSALINLCNRLALAAFAVTAGCRAINLSARPSNSFPGAILCQGDAPDGCGSGITSKRCPSRSTPNLRPITFSNFAQSINRMIASRPTGITRRGRRISISSSIHEEQLRISSGAGTRSVPPEFFPGKHRQTAAK